MNITPRTMAYAEKYLDFTSKDYSDKVVIVAKSKDNRFREAYWIMKSLDGKTDVEHKILNAKKHLFEQYRVFAQVNIELMLDS